MRARFWKMAARAIAASPRLVDWLIARAQRTPYFHIGDYMDRWWMMPRWALTYERIDGRRVLVPRSWLPFSIRIHHIKRADEGDALHDHPFNYRTIILRGGYVEEDVFGFLRFMSPGSTAAAHAQTFHRIAAVPREGVWTLFIMGPKANRWGFMIGGRKVYYRDYLGLNDAE